MELSTSSRAVPNEHASRAALSSDGSRAVVGRANGRVSVFDGTVLAFLRAVPPAETGVSAVAISGDGSTVAYSSYTTLRVWNLERDEVWEHALSGDDIALALSRDGRRCVAIWRGGINNEQHGDDGMVHMWRDAAPTATVVVIEDLRVAHTVELPGTCDTVAFLDDATARFEITTIEPRGRHVEHWTFTADGITKGEEPAPPPSYPSSRSGRPLSAPTSEGLVYVLGGDAREAIASLDDAPTTIEPRVVAEPMYAAGTVTAAGKTITFDVENWTTRQKYRHTLAWTGSGTAEMRFPHVAVRDGARTVLDYVALPSGEFLATDGTRWFGSAKAFESGVLLRGGRAFATIEAATAAVGAPDPAVLAEFTHTVVNAKRAKAAKTQKVVPTKAASKKSASKKVDLKKPAPKKSASTKAASKKPAPTKPGSKKAASKKPAARKSAKAKRRG